ncbi:phosphoribosylpyrophosphate synthetase [Chitinophagaceae bacterium LWZ2-11]
MSAYDTLSGALNDLRLRGFTVDFNIEFDKIKCKKEGKELSTEQFEIVEHHRFEGETDPGDESVVYAIEAKDGTMRGVLVSAYGAYSDSASEEMIQKLTVHE